MISKIEQIKLQNTEAIVEKFSQLDVVNYDTVSNLIPQLLTEGLLTLDPSVYTPADSTTKESNGIGRHLIYDHKDKSNPFSIWIFSFATRQRTSIHDHQYEGTVTVLKEPITEKYFQPSGDHYARHISSLDRNRFHTNKDDLKDNFVHQLKRRKDLGIGISTTLHIYKMEAHKISENGELTDRRNFFKIYTKDKRPQDDQEKNPDVTLCP